MNANNKETTHLWYKCKDRLHCNLKYVSRSWKFITSQVRFFLANVLSFNNKKNCPHSLHDYKEMEKIMGKYDLNALKEGPGPLHTCLFNFFFN